MLVNNDLPPALGGVADWRVELVAPARFACIDRFYREQGHKVKCAPNETVFSLSIWLNSPALDTVVAAARLVPQLSGDFWLRNLLVAKDCRGQGMARRLMVELLAQIPPNGCYCYALPHLKAFYLSLGFELQPVHCPPDIKQKYEQYRARGRDWLLMGIKL